MKDHEKRRTSPQGLFLAGLLSIVILMSGACSTREHKDMILVLDTSLSMVGYGGKNIMAGVKEGLNGLVDQLEEGDSFSFITFDSEVKMYPDVYIRGENDKEILKKYLSMVEARGLWTYTQKMMRRVFDKAKELEDRDKDRQRVIVVLTDGLDDPPPGRRYERFDIKDVARQHNNKDWFIFFVNLGDLATSKAIQKAGEETKETVSPYARVVDATQDPGKVIEQDLMKGVKDLAAERRESERTFLSSPWFIALLVLLLLLALFLLIRRFRGLRVAGVLEYWNNNILDPYVYSVNLTRQERSKVIIGRGSGCTVTIRDIEIQEPFTIVAKRDRGEVKYAFQTGRGTTIEFKDGAGVEYLKDGDIFTVANYTFKYSIG